MQKNPINEGDSIQEPMTLQDYEDAVSLPDGIYPITDDAGTVLDASVIAYGNETVEDALNNRQKIIWESSSDTADITSATQIYSGTEHFKAFILICGGANTASASNIIGGGANGKPINITYPWYQSGFHIRERSITISESSGVVTLTPEGAKQDGSSTSNILVPRMVIGIIE